MLTYKQHGGSGLNWSLSDVNELDLGAIQWYLDRLAERRAEEASAIAKAGKH